METKEEILTELEMKIEAICSKYENAFKGSNRDLKSFFDNNGAMIKKEIATESTNALHKGILNNLAQDKDFTQKILELNYIGAEKIHNSIISLQ